MRILAKSDVGKARDMNQDFYYVSDLEKDEVKLYILADRNGRLQRWRNCKQLGCNLR